MRNTINLFAFGNFLVGIFLIYLTFFFEFHLFFSVIGFIGGLILTIVEGKFLFDKVIRGWLR